ncbi:RNA polymerase sigma factor [Flavobacterium sp.]|uniref:RNA polymerase sigma factor n=1 Tax=Flavobacterium sp. TaxID=239 RepID=UPI0038FCDF1A
MNVEILTDLKGENNSAFGELYKNYFYSVNRFITNNNGSTNDAEDVFQDTMIILLEKLRKDNFQLTASLKTYIMAISKNIWLNKLRKTYKEVDLTNENSNIYFEQIDIAIDDEKNYMDKLQNYLHKITEHCQGLIHDMFFKEKSIEIIQKEYGYSTIHNAQNQKHKCIEQIRKVKSQDKN